MANYTVPTAEQKQLCRECGLDPDGVMVMLDNEQCLVLLHLKSRNELMIYKNRRVTNGNQ
ncbi:MAG: hypothetical protein IJ448_01350 [Oscillospiraceae bacterium]|nr:hypothetical protein [Oscillospiraceae bacterium]